MIDSTARCIGLIESDAELSTQINQWLTTNGHTFTLATNADDFSSTFKESKFDVVIIDWKHQSILKNIDHIRRQAAVHVPVMVISNKDKETDIADAFDAGADSYLVNPIRQFEFLARIKSLVRRVQKYSVVMQYEPFNFDITNRDLTARGDLIQLTEKEYDFALYLFRNQGRVLSRHRLLTAVWGLSNNVSTRTIDTHASRLRKKLNLTPTGQWSLTAISRHGYVLESI